MFTYLLGRFLRRLFSCFTGWRIYIYLLWLEGIRFYLSKILSAFFTRSLAWDSVHHDLCSKTDYSLFLLTERRCHFRFRVLANRFASIFLLSLSGDSLGLLYVSVHHSLPIRSQSTNISWFPI